MNKLSNRHKPPWTADWLLRRFTHDHEETKSGDYEEEFNENTEEYGLSKAKLVYWNQALKSIPVFAGQSVNRSIAMFKNYIKIASRNIRKYKVYSLINVSGLAAGLTCFLLIFLWIQDEFSYDRFHENADTIYRINSTKRMQSQTVYMPETSLALADVLKEQYPEIVNSVRTIGDWSGWQVNYEDKYFSNDRLFCAGPEFFEMFTFPFIEGDPKTALNTTFSIVITEDMAEKYFGSEDPMGKMINIYGRGYEVKGIIKNVPENSHIKFDAVFPFTYWRDVRRTDLNSWTEDFSKTFIQVRENTSKDDLEQKIAGIVSRNDPNLDVTLELQPLKKIHLYSSFSHEFWGMGRDINSVYIFSAIAVCVLIIACINFMNLSTAISGKRAREIGIRKVSGAHRKDIIKQFMMESVFLSVFALIIALVFCSLLLSVFNELTGKNLEFDSIINFPFITGLVLLSVFTGMFSGSYPALFLSALKPSHIIKGINKTGNRIGGRIRKVLVITQFALTVVLMIESMVLYQQLDFINSKDPGYDKENLVLFDREGAFDDNYEMTKNELLRNPDVLSVTRSRWPLMGGMGLSNEVSWEGRSQNDNIRMLEVSVDHDYLDTYKIRLAEGRFFSRQLLSDTSNYLINETAAKMIGFEEPVGKRFSYRGREGIIIGVIKDFNHQSFRQRIEPQFYRYHTNTTIFCVKLSSEKFSEGMDFLEEKWNEFAPGYAFKYHIHEESLERFYRDDERNGKLISFFAYLAIIISCMGLFGLAMYIAELRTKEIGIRKVLGSSVSGVILLLSKEFVIWIVIANMIAWPAAYILGNDWLNNFIFRIDLSWQFFIAAGAATVLISVLSVGYQALKTAMSNPVDTLRYE
ncbi:MAG: FtsX-like permease family protein [bacterium]|nr:FtsX-like permease family protein [bacterium]